MSQPKDTIRVSADLSPQIHAALEEVAAVLDSSHTEALRRIIILARTLLRDRDAEITITSQGKSKTITII